MHAPHLFSLRVYYEDTDFSGYVYHASYLRFLERGRTEYLRTHGISNLSLFAEEDGLALVVSRMSLDYLRPAAMDDELTIVTDLEEARGAVLRLAQQVRRGPTRAGRGQGARRRSTPRARCPAAGADARGIGGSRSRPQRLGRVQGLGSVGAGDAGSDCGAGIALSATGAGCPAWAAVAAALRCIGFFGLTAAFLSMPGLMMR